MKNQKISPIRILAFGISVCSIMVSPIAAEGPWFLGEWHISGFYLTRASALDSSEAEGWIGRPVRINASSFVFYKDTCSKSSYVSRATDRDDFFLSVYRIPPENVGITNRVISITEIRCAETSPQTLISQNNSDLIIENMGVFFTLKRGKGTPRSPKVELTPEEALSQAHVKALALARSGKNKEAAEVLIDGAGDPPWVMYQDNVAIFEDFGRILIAAKIFDKAIEVFTAVLGADPHRTPDYLHIGDAYLGAGDVEQATNAYLQYSELMEQEGKQKQIPARINKYIK